jgi:imidazolonepropionase-like amidohydrolase
MRRHVLIVMLAAAAGTVAAAPVEPVPPPQGQPLIIRNATLHTLAGPALVGGSLLVERGRIVALAAAGQALPAPSAPALTLDLSGKHVYPGFIGANTTLGLSEVTAVAATVDTTETGALNPNARAVSAINADSDLIGVARAGGVLAALVVPQVRGGGIAGTSAFVQLDGWDWQQMALVPELGLHVALPSLRLNAEMLSGPLAPLADELRRFSAQRLRDIDEAFGAAAAYARARAADPALPADQRWEAMRPVFGAGAQQRPVFVQANEVAQIRHALALAERHGLKLVIVGGADAWRLADVLKAREVPVVITGVHRLPLRRDDDVDAPFRLAAQLAAAGVRFAIARGAAGSASTNERLLPLEAATAVAHGLPHDEALKAITLYPAQILGVADRLGTLEAGKLASFIVTDGDPLQTATQIERLFVQGREVSAANRQTRLADRYRERPVPR